MPRTRSILLLCAAFMATGSQWDALQAFAWARMIYTSASTRPLSEAVVEAFAPDNLCPICRMVNKARQQESHSMPEAKFSQKVDLFFQPGSSPMVAVNPPAGWPLSDSSMPPSVKAEPPLRPPRLAA